MGIFRPFTLIIYLNFLMAMFPALLWIALDNAASFVSFLNNPSIFSPTVWMKFPNLIFMASNRFTLIMSSSVLVFRPLLVIFSPCSQNKASPWGYVTTAAVISVTLLSLICWKISWCPCSRRLTYRKPLHHPMLCLNTIGLPPGCVRTQMRWVYVSTIHPQNFKQRINARLAVLDLASHALIAPRIHLILLGALGLLLDMVWSPMVVVAR